MRGLNVLFLNDLNINLIITEIKQSRKKKKQGQDGEKPKRIHLNFFFFLKRSKCNLN